MARKKTNNTLILLAAAAVAGYFIFKKGVGTQPAQTAAGVRQIAPGDWSPYANLPVGIAVERPTMTDIGIIAPKVDPTGMQIDFY